MENHYVITSAHRVAVVVALAGTDLGAAAPNLKHLATWLKRLPCFSSSSEPPR